MSPAAPSEHAAEPSKPAKSRTLGIVYLLYFLTAIFSAAIASKPQFAFAFNIISLAFYVAVTILFYQLFKPVNRSLTFIAALASFAGCTVQALGLFQPNSAFAKFSPLAFFGPYCILIGFLIIKSFFLPRFLGILMIVAGMTWLLVLPPTFTKHLLAPAEVLGFLAELALCLWLLVFGVNTQRTSK